MSKKTNTNKEFDTAINSVVEEIVDLPVNDRITPIPYNELKHLSEQGLLGGEPTASSDPDCTKHYHWDYDKLIWSAKKAHAESAAWEKRINEQNMYNIMQYIKTAADAGKFTCTIYQFNIERDIDIKAIITRLEKLGYTVTRSTQYNEWSITISW